jgi:hypothetical protein
MGQLADQKHHASLLQTFLPSMDGMVERLTTENLRVLDVGCGGCSDLLTNLSFEVMDATHIQEQHEFATKPIRASIKTKIIPWAPCCTRFH